MLCRMWVTLMLALASFPVSAMDVEGVKLDDAVTVDNQQLVLNGAGVRKKLLLKIYICSLYIPDRTNQTAAVMGMSPRRVQMNMIRDSSSERVIGALLDGLEANNTPAERAPIQAQIDQMVAVLKSLPGLDAGDVVAADYINGATHFVVNGESKGAIPGEAFNQAFIKIWLGNRPVDSDLKRAMLGMGS